jgi:branched-chain amino acid transport system substrate-binding protein
MARKIRRRRFLQAGAGLALGFAAPPILAQTRTPIRIGLLNTFSGPSAQPGEYNLNGMNLYFDRIGWTVAGRKIEIIKEDDQFNPQIGLQKAKKFVESDKVDMILGPQGSNVAMALLNYVKESKAFLIVHGAGTDSITWEHIPTMFRTSLSTWQLCHPMAEWVYDNLAKEIVLSAADYAGGRDVLREFRVAYLAKGGKVLKEIYPPLNTTDFSPYLADIRSINPPATYSFYPGQDAVRFVQQYAQFGVKARMTGFAALVDSTTIEAQGRTALGALTSTTYTDLLVNAENKQFVAEYRARFKDYPNSFSDYGIVAAQAIEAALKATDGDASDKDKLAQAMVKVSFKAPRGPFRFDPVTHNPIQDIYICEMQDNGSRLVNAVIGTLRDVQAPATKDG